MRNTLRFLSALFILLIAAEGAWGEDFTVIVLPDTQFYSESYPHILNAQTKWIADNASALNIKMVIGTGDIVNDGSSLTQWQVADAAFRALDDARIPYVVTPGNHDYKWKRPDTRDLTNYNTYFGAKRFGSFGPYGGYPDGTNDNSYTIFTVGDTTYLVIALENFPRDSALAWAETVIKNNPAAKVIVTTHAYMFNDNFRQGRCDWNSAEDFSVGPDNDGEEMWEKLVNKHANIFLVLSGHVSGVGRRADRGVNGNVVHQVLADYQSEEEGGGGYLRILNFRPELNVIEVKTYSPFHDQYRTDPANEFTISLAQPATTGNAAVSGKVRKQADCSPIAGATAAAGTSTAKTDAKGIFALTVPAQPAVQVLVSAADFTTSTQTVNAAAGLSAQAKFLMQPACAAPAAAASYVNVCSPASGATVTAPFVASAAAFAPAGARKLEFWLDGAKKYEAFAATASTAITAASGDHRLSVVGVDASGAVTKTTVTVKVGSTTAPATPPTTEPAPAPAPSPTCSAPATSSLSVVVCSPQLGSTVASPVRVWAAASAPSGIKRIEIWMDGVKKTEVFKSLIDYPLGASAGDRRITVISVDNSGAILKKDASVTVK